MVTKDAWIKGKPAKICNNKFKVNQKVKSQTMVTKDTWIRAKVAKICNMFKLNQNLSKTLNLCLKFFKVTISLNGHSDRMKKLF